MKFLTEKKTLFVGALSLLGGVTVSLMTNQHSPTVQIFAQSASSTQMAASLQNVSVQKSYILQGGTRQSLVTAIENAGAKVSREFPIISAVSAMLTDDQFNLLAANGIRITTDHKVQVLGSKDKDKDKDKKDKDKAKKDKDEPAGKLRGKDKDKSIIKVKDKVKDKIDTSGKKKKASIDTFIATQTEANLLHDMGITGEGVTVAILDSGTMMDGDIGKHLLNNKKGSPRAFYKYDALKSKVNDALDDDENGHGTHVSSIIATSLKDENGHYNGMAPDAYLLSVKAFNKDGEGSYTDVLDGLNWIYQNRQRYGIRVLNLSLGAKVQSNYWNDPINQAVMRLWDAGIVVVTSAGNTGSDNATITVPGNVPYIITVGAVTDSYTPSDFSDDRLTSFSSRGPTHEGFVKPEVVAWGGHIEMKMNSKNLKTKKWFNSASGDEYYGESGTSQAAAVVTGIVALMLDDDSSLSPNDVKCRLMSASQPINNPATDSKYSPFAQGSGLVNAYQSVLSNASGCANKGLDIKAEINGIEHFKGPTVVSESGELMIDFGNGNLVAEGSVWGSGTLLEGSVWGGGAILEGSVWGGGTMLEGSVWGGGTVLEGSVWGGGAILEGSIWGGGSDLEGSIWGGDTDLEGSIWGGDLNLEGATDLLDYKD